MNSARLFLALEDLMKALLLASCYFAAAGRPFPYLSYSLAFFLSLLISRGARRKALRVLTYVILNFLGIVLTFLAAYASLGGNPFDPRGPLAGNGLFDFFSALAWCVVFWFRGEWLGKKTADHPFCVARFDEGIAVFLFALTVMAAFRITNPLAGRLLVPFFLFGTLAMGTSKREGLHPGVLEPKPGNRRTAATASAAAVICASILYLMPAFLSPARRAGETLAGAWRTLEPYLATFLRWLFGFRPPPIAESTSSGGGVADRILGSESGEGGRVLSRVFLWILGAVVAAAAIVLLASALVALIRALAARLKDDGDSPKKFSLLRWLRYASNRITRFLARIRKILSGRKNDLGEARSAYARCLACGRRAGAPRRGNETPREYASRLRRTFPRSAEQAIFVVESLEREIYGEKILDDDTRRHLSDIKRRMRPSSFRIERALAVGSAMRQKLQKVNFVN